jgi:hypothetical protein
MIRVRVTGTKFRTNWYAQKIGEVFEVDAVKHKYGALSDGKHEELWVVVTPPGEPYKRIWETDCEVVKDTIPNKHKRLIRVE